MTRVKDGGAFVKFKYTEPPTSGEANALEPAVLEAELKEQLRKAGGISTWVGQVGGDLWLVRGKPWREVDLSSLHRCWLSFE
jgi:hypothetical protein